MTVSTMPVTACSPVAGWLLPTPSNTRNRLEGGVFRKDVFAKEATDERRARPLRRLGVVARQALIEETEAKLRMVLGDTLVDLIVGGWRAHGTITQAARNSRNRPGIDHVIPLRNHTVTANTEHNLDIEVDGVTVTTLVARLAMRVHIYDAVAIVKDGRLVAIRSGNATADGTVTVDGVRIAHRTLTFPLSTKIVPHSSGGAQFDRHPIWPASPDRYR